MAKYTIEDTTLTNIATAIRNKTGDSATLKPSEMPNAIESIETGTDLSEYFKTSGFSKPSSSSTVWHQSVLKTPTLDVTGLTDMGSAFRYYPGEKLSVTGDTSRVTSWNYAFHDTNLTEIPMLDTSGATSMTYMFKDSQNIQTIPLLNTSKVIQMQYMFQNCTSLIEIPAIDTSSATNFSTTFSGCTNLKTLPQLDFSKASSLSSTFVSCSKLENLGGFLNYGNNFSTTMYENNSSYTLTLSVSTKITRDSLMNVINGLCDIATKGCTTQKLVLGSTNLAKLTAEEIAIATNKGWSVS